ncbi:MAG: type I-MYXAN CRISPR-associated protein Cas6/Cmx6 [Pseudomonadota bacterium]
MEQILRATGATIPVDRIAPYLALADRHRPVSVHGKQVGGYSPLVFELTAEESIALQANGPEGRRKMGCSFLSHYLR